MKIEPFPTLLPREIPFLDESPLAPQRVVAWYGVTPQPDLPVDQRLYEEALIAAAGRAGRRPGRAACAPMRARPSCARRPDCDVSFLLDFGRIHSGYPFIELEADGGEVIEVAVAEGIPGEWDATPPAQPRIDRERGARRAPLPLHRAPRRAALRALRVDGGALRAGDRAQRAARPAHPPRRLDLHALPGRAERGAFDCSDDAAEPAVGHRPLHAAAVHARRLGRLSGARAAPVARRRDRRVPRRPGGVRSRASTRSTGSSCATAPRASGPTG